MGDQVEGFIVKSRDATRFEIALRVILDKCQVNLSAFEAFKVFLAAGALKHF